MHDDFIEIFQRSLNGKNHTLYWPENIEIRFLSLESFNFFVNPWALYRHRMQVVRNNFFISKSLHLMELQFLAPSANNGSAEGDSTMCLQQSLLERIEIEGVRARAWNRKQIFTRRRLSFARSHQKLNSKPERDFLSCRFQREHHRWSACAGSGLNEAVWLRAAPSVRENDSQWQAFFKELSANEKVCFESYNQWEGFFCAISQWESFFWKP